MWSFQCLQSVHIFISPVAHAWWTYMSPVMVCLSEVHMIILMFQSFQQHLNIMPSTYKLQISDFVELPWKSFLSSTKSESYSL